MLVPMLSLTRTPAILFRSVLATHFVSDLPSPMRVFLGRKYQSSWAKTPNLSKCTSVPELSRALFVHTSCMQGNHQSTEDCSRNQAPIWLLLRRQQNDCGNTPAKH